MGTGADLNPPFCGNQQSDSLTSQEGRDRSSFQIHANTATLIPIHKNKLQTKLLVINSNKLLKIIIN
jgi:hypothetical protein